LVYHFKFKKAKIEKEIEKLEKGIIANQDQIDRSRQKTPMYKSQLARKDTGASEVNADQVNINIHSNKTSALD